MASPLVSFPSPLSFRFVIEVGAGGGFHSYNRMYQVILHDSTDHDTKYLTVLILFVLILLYFIYDMVNTLSKQVG